MRYYMHIALPEKLAKRVTEIEKQYEGNSRSEPHITIMKSREMLSGETEQELIAAIHSAIQIVKPFKIILKGMGYFGKRKTIHIQIERTPEFVECHNTIMEAVQKILRPSKSRYIQIPQPHITLVSRLSRKKGKEIWEKLKNKKFSGQFNAKNITLLQTGKHNERWQTVALFSLGK